MKKEWGEEEWHGPSRIEVYKEWGRGRIGENVEEWGQVKHNEGKEEDTDNENKYRMRRRENEKGPLYKKMRMNRIKREEWRYIKMRKRKNEEDIEYWGWIKIY